MKSSTESVDAAGEALLSCSHFTYIAKHWLQHKNQQKNLTTVEASAMATMDTNLVMKTRLRGGLGRFVTGESIFINAKN